MTVSRVTGKTLRYIYITYGLLLWFVFFINIPYSWYKYGFRSFLAYYIPFSRAGFRLYVSMLLLSLPAFGLRYLSKRLLNEE